MKIAKLVLVTSALILCVLPSYSNQSHCLHGVVQIQNPIDAGTTVSGTLEYCSNGSCYAITSTCGTSQLNTAANSACTQMNCNGGTVQFQSDGSCNQSVENLYCSSCQVIGFPSNCTMASASCNKRTPLPLTNFRLTHSYARSLQLSWTAPRSELCRRAVSHYRVGCPSEIYTTTSTSRHVYSLQPYTSYRCCVRAYDTSSNSGNAVCETFWTAEAAPSTAPTGVTATPQNATTATITWTNIPQTYRNGVIRYYNVQLASAETGTQLISLRSYAGSSLRVSSLHPAYTYRVSVAGYTVAYGPFSSPITMEMPEAAPSRAPIGVIATPQSATTATITWTNIPQAYHNGVIRYYTVQLTSMETGTRNERAYTRSGSLRVSSLHPAYTYRVSVAGNTVAQGPFSNIINMEMPEAAPSRAPIGVIATPQSATTATITWTNIPQAYRNGVIRYYTVQLASMETGTRIERAYTRSGSLRVSSLHPAYTYRVSVAGHTVAQGPFSNIINMEMPEAAPSHPPLVDRSREYSTPRSLHLWWGPPPEEHRNGVIRGYTIRIKYMYKERRVTLTLNSISTNTVARELRPHTRYTYSISAFTEAGSGPFTDPIIIQTLEDVPSSAPQNITVKPLSPTSLLFKWIPPLEDDWNGLLTGYTLILTWRTGQEQRSTVDTNYTFTDLLPDTTYHCSIAASTSIGEGPYHNDTVRTPAIAIGSNLLEAALAGVFGAILILSLLCAIVTIACFVRWYRQKHKKSKGSEPQVQNLRRARRCDDKELVTIKFKDKPVKTETTVESKESQLIIGTLPREFLSDLEDVEAHVDMMVPNLPERSYLEDTEFVSKLADNHESHKEHLPSEMPQKLFLDDAEMSPAITASQSSHNEKDTATQRLHYMSLSEATREKQSLSSKETHYMALSEATRNQKHSLSSEETQQYMSLSEATRDHHGNDHYMSVSVRQH